MSNEPIGYAIKRGHVSQYFFWTQVLFLFITTIWFFGIGIALAVIYAFTLGTWLPRMQSEALRYWLDGSTLRVNQGVYYLKRKAIPLDRVTDVMLVQGPLLRLCRIWALHIQTAGLSGHAVAEAILYGLENPEQVRDELLAARDAAARRNSA